MSSGTIKMSQFALHNQIPRFELLVQIVSLPSGIKSISLELPS